MLDLRFIRENADAVRAAIGKRGVDVEFDRLLQADAELLALRRKRDDSKAEQNRLSKSVPGLEGEEKAAAIAKSKELGASIKPLDEQMSALEVEVRALLLTVPNMPDPEVPEGLEAENNKELRRWGDAPEFDFECRDHVDLLTTLGLLDMPRAANVAGSRTYFLRGDLFLLEMAVLRYAFELVVSRGYVPVSPPLIVNRGAMEGTGYLPIGADQAYECTRNDGWLIGTSEVPITAMHAGEKLPVEELPLRYAGYSACFRREAGAHGKDTRGLFRVHQFTKVEQVVICSNSESMSRSLHEEILANAEDVLKALELPYRVVGLCGGDLGRSSAYTYDIETWMPGRGDFGETHSASRYYEYQARRLDLRYRDEKKKVRFCHTLNNTVLASPRILVAIVENHQQKDGSIKVPDVLVPYMGKDRIAPVGG